MLNTGLRHYTWVIWHWLWLILLGTAICAGATFGISVSMKPVYQATALIQVNSSTTDAEYNSELGKQALAQSDSLLVTNDDVLQQVAKNLPGMSLSQLRAAVSDSPEDNTSIIQVRAQASDPQVAAYIANEVVNVFIQLQLQKTTTRLQGIASQISQQLATAKASVDMAQAGLVALQDSHATADKIAHQKNILDTDQANYTSLLTSYQNVQLQELQASNVLSVAQTATPPDKPTSPQITLNTAIAMLMGLLLMVVLALLLDWIDATIKTSEDVAQLAALQPLGSIPFMKKANRKSLLMMNSSAIEEAFVTISTNFSMLNKGQRSILVTSMQPGTGTSTTAANLAISLALSGVRVLLIDANLRRPSLHSIFNRSYKNGWISSLKDVYRFQEHQIAQLYSWLDQWKTPIPNLWFLPAGPVPAHSMTLLRTPALRMLVGSLLQQHQVGSVISRVVEVIIFDTSSLEEGADVAALAPITDGSVLVIEAGKERSETLNNVRATFQRFSSPILGVVVTRQKPKHRPYFYVDRDQRDMVPAEDVPVNALAKRSLLTPQGASPDASQILSATPAPSLPPGRYRMGEQFPSSASHLPMQDPPKQQFYLPIRTNRSQ